MEYIGNLIHVEYYLYILYENKRTEMVHQNVKMRESRSCTLLYGASVVILFDRPVKYRAICNVYSENKDFTSGYG
jgi:hypothetical protein